GHLGEGRGHGRRGIPELGGQGVSTSARVSRSIGLSLAGSALAGVPGASEESRLRAVTNRSAPSTASDEVWDRSAWAAFTCPILRGRFPVPWLFGRCRAGRPTSPCWPGGPTCSCTVTGSAVRVTVRAPGSALTGGAVALPPGLTRGCER